VDVEAQEEESIDGSENNIMGVRRSKRIRKKKLPQVIDFSNKKAQGSDGIIHAHVNDFSYRPKLTVPTPKSVVMKQRCSLQTYQLMEGIMHINPSICEQAHKSLKCKGLEKLQEYNSNTKENCLIEGNVVTHILGAVLTTQYSIKKGIRLFGDRGKHSVRSELQQLHDMVTFIPVSAHELTHEQQKQALASLMFMTEKRCGCVKSRACANGSKQ
jgi:hypothetical protein